MHGAEPTGREHELRKVIRSLSQVSQVETREIREQIEKARKCKNNNRKKRQVEADELLKKQRGDIHLPNLLFSYRLFEGKGHKLESLKERYIQSQAYLQRANFQYKKIALKKQDIAHKQRRHQHQCASAPLINKFDRQQQEKTQEKDPFDTPNHHMPEPVDPVLIDRLKGTVNSSRKQMRELYDSHVRHVSSLPFRTEPSHSEITPAPSTPSETPSNHLFKPTRSVLLLPTNRRKRKPLEELIRMSSIRSRQEEPITEQTIKEQQDKLATEEAMVEAEDEIERGNKLKESIVLGHLKKLLYGDRKGRFIQDTTFRTRLRGEHSDQYMRVVQKQQQMLSGFNGSYINRRNLAQRFANILGTLRTHATPPQDLPQ